MKLALRVLLILILAFSVVILFAATKGDAKKGQDLYVTKCKACHGDKGVGNPNLEKMLSVKIPPFNTKDVQSLSDEQIGKVINDGKGKMKPVKLSEAEVADVIAYLRTLAPPSK